MGIKPLPVKLKGWCLTTRPGEHLVDYFQHFSGFIERKLTHEAYGEFMFDSFSVFV
jgi:hypothetical protein